jgi:hypothetical protein
MDYEQRKDETLEDFRARLNRDFDARFPRLARLKLHRPWDEKDDLWFEAVTGEAIPTHERATRNPGL